MKLLVVGGGAREHTIVWKVLQSPGVAKVYCAPGNAGTAQVAENVPIAAGDIPALLAFARDNAVDLTIVGPEDPLALGLVDAFEAAGLVAFGPSAAGARIESSKAWGKQIMSRAGVPTARSEVFTDYEAARAYVEAGPIPIVIVADGLAAGKGVTVARTLEEALGALADCMEKRVFGAAGERVLVEEFLEGPEVSLLCFTDGQTVRPMAPACDYKPIYDGNRGPNTGGVGCYSPPGFVSVDLMQEILDTIVTPTARQMAAEGIVYKGVLYCGLMITAAGPKVIEFNCRFGDPETQVILPRLRGDLVDIMLKVAQGRLHLADFSWSDEVSCGVVLTSAGYPGSYRTGLPISGLNQVDPDVMVFHAGTKLADGQVVTAGGRVLTIVALGSTMALARRRVYANTHRVQFEGAYHRTDIALREVQTNA